MPPTTNRAMNDMMRQRRADMMPAYEGPEEEKAEGPAETDPSKYKVAAPGEPSSGDKFEYEPLTDTPGAWAVYPPGVPCDENEYRVMMDRPADEDDFAGMQTAIDAAGGGNAEPAAAPAEGEGY